MPGTLWIRSALACACLIALSLAGTSPHAESPERHALASMIEDAHAVADVVENQIGEMEDFRRNGSGYMLRDTNGSLYFLPYSDAEDIASMLALQVWMGNADAFRGVGGDLDGRINALHDELTEINDLIEDAELELAALDNQETDEQVEATENITTEDDVEIDWRAAMAERGAVLPDGVTLIDPVPTMDRICNEPAETPIWILVADASACTGSWKAKGSDDYNGIEGRWCVWCPADMYWRSGWGCCFPN